MNIKILQSMVETLSLKPSEAEKGKVNMTYESLFSEDDPKKFIVTFDVEIDTPDLRNIQLRYVSFFSADEDIAESEKHSPFFKVNAPAIAYPFLRAYIANLLVSSGFQPVMLPTVNFVEFSKTMTSGRVDGKDSDKEGKS